MLLMTLMKDIIVVVMNVNITLTSANLSLRMANITLFLAQEKNGKMRLLHIVLHAITWSVLN